MADLLSREYKECCLGVFGERKDEEEKRNRLITKGESLVLL